jgi:hypothetical protein
MTETSYPFFAEEIQKFGDRDFVTEPKAEERRLHAAFEFFTGKVARILDAIDVDSMIVFEEKVNVKVARLVDLRDTVLFLSLIRIELGNEDDAYLIFETLNTRGKDLALSDLLKNHFSKLIKPKSSVNAVKLQWAHLLSTLNRSNIDLDNDTFFTHSWSSRYDSTTQQKAYKKIKAEIKSANAREHLRGFVEDAGHYVSLFNPESGWDKGQVEIARSLHAMRIFRISQHTPGVLSLVRANKNQLISDRALKRALRAIENFHFLFTAVTSSRSSGGISAMYSSFGRKIFEAEDSNTAGVVINELIGKLDERKPTLPEFIAGFEQINYTAANTKQSPLVRYILQKLAANGGLAFTEDLSLLTIEHVHPQSKIDQCWKEEIVGSIGNLILLPAKNNGDLRNDAFEAKRTYFTTIQASIPRDVLWAHSWTPNEVRDRTRRLAELSYNEVWKIS